jgi:hypothetical protein
MTVTDAKPAARAWSASPYWRGLLSVFPTTCDILDCRKYTAAPQARWSAVILWLIAAASRLECSAERREQQFGQCRHRP